jgi:predicted Rossmann-fold nucleotide-binding protein
MEVLTMNQLSEIDKPVGILNTAGFFAKFLEFIDHMIDTRFLPEQHRRAILVDDDPSTLVSKFRSYERVEAPKWL